MLKDIWGDFKDLMGDVHRLSKHFHFPLNLLFYILAVPVAIEALTRHLFRWYVKKDKSRPGGIR